MTRRRGPTKRLLIAPALLLVAMVFGLHLVQGGVPRPVDPGLAVPSEPSPEQVRDRSCRRGHDPALISELRSALPPDAIVASTDVVACPTAYDGRRVRYRGEVVGDVLRRDAGAWVLVNDDAYALEVGPLPAHREHRGTNTGLTVWVPEHLLDAIGGTGRPGRRGDLVEVAGRIVRTDPSDGGGLTLRATNLQILAPAVAVDEPLDLPQLWLAIGVLTVAAGLTVVRRRAVTRR
jgi:hypothetical protein